MYITGQGDYTAALQVQQSAREDCEETTGQSSDVFDMFDLFQRHLWRFIKSLCPGSGTKQEQQQLRVNANPSRH